MTNLNEVSISKLTPRELDVMRLICAHYTNREMATELGISEKTVETHRANINRRLGTHDTAEVFHVGALHGMVAGLAPRPVHKIADVVKAAAGLV